MTADLVAFLRARLDDDEQVAQAAWPGPWAPDAEEYGVVDPADGTEIADVVTLSTNQQRAATRHIARHDPARVLAEIDAKRRLLALHERFPQPQSMRGGQIWACGTCGSVDDSPVEWPCETLRLLALPYANHSDCQPEWAAPA